GFGASGFRRTICAALLLLAPFFTLLTTGARAADAPQLRFYAESTGHTIGDDFLRRWIADDGANTLGDPVSEVVKASGKTYQYFQFGALVGSKSGGDVSRMPVAQALLNFQVQNRDTAGGRRALGVRDANAGAAVASDPGAKNIVWDKKTKHTISGAILGFYKKHNGVASFGHPLTEAYASGGYTIQWFQYGRIQVDLSGQVTAGHVGFEYARALGVDSAKVKRGNLPLFSASRFKTFVGDGTVPEASGIFAPVKIEIPAIGVDANIEQVGIVNGAMGTPQDAWNVGWYPQLSWPGQYSNVVMAGHRDWWGIGPTVFWNLPNLAAGEMIYLVGADGTGATYKITDVYSVDSTTDAGQVVGDTGSDMLTLITCDGSFNGSEYLSRQIVRASRI
ncbi:MAG: class F sortase, partial [Rhizobiales bacterium]|nr:class F sortase [Hyphomicrobiales bacterium]